MESKKQKLRNTLFLFSKNNKVYLTKNEAEWSPINFQWIPLVKLQKEFNYGSTSEDD